jgi:hypothetical protein
LRGIDIEVQDVLPVAIEDAVQPGFQGQCLLGIATMTDELDTASKFTDRDDGQEEGIPTVCRLPEEAMTPGFARGPLRASLMTLVSIKNTGCVGAGVHPFEVRVLAHIRHGRQDFSKGALARRSQRGGQDGPVFCFCAQPVLSGALLQRPDHGFIDTSDQQVRHAKPRNRSYQR